MTAKISCYLCDAEFDAMSSETVEEAARRNGMSGIEIDQENFCICGDCANAIKNKNILVKKASRSNKYANHVYLPTDQEGRKAVVILH